MGKSLCVYGGLCACMWRCRACAPGQRVCLRGVVLTVGSLCGSERQQSSALSSAPRLFPRPRLPCLQHLCLVSPPCFPASSQETQNLKSRVQKQQVFEEELADNENLLRSLQQTGQEMIEKDHYASPQVAARVDEVLGLWKELLEATAQRGQHRGGHIGDVGCEGA